MPRWRPVAVGAVVLATAASAFLAYDLNFVNYDTDDGSRYPYVYVHSTREMLTMLDQIEDIATEQGTGTDTGITIVSPDYWPLPWYLRDYPKAGFWGRLEDVTLDQPIIIANTNQREQLEPLIAGQFEQAGTYKLRPGVDLDVYVAHGRGSVVTRRSAILRLLIGLAISAVFLALTLSRVNLAEVGAAIAAASPAWLLVALGIVIVDVLLRALRWQFLLHGVPGAGTKPPYRLAVGYLMIGFTANAILPARLGDIARAILAGDAFRIPRLAVFGTILIERLGDGLTMLLLALVSSIVVASGIAELRDLAVFAIGAGIAGVIALAIMIVILSRPRVRATRFGGLVFGLLERVAAGAGAMTTVRGAAIVVGLTWIVAFTAILVAWAVTNSVGLQLTPVQLVLFMSGIALSLAIPAAPGALGTYEFVGVAIITSLGYTAEQGLAAILLMRVITTFPPALAGLVSLFILQIRPGELVHAAEEPPPAAEPADADGTALARR